MPISEIILVVFLAFQISAMPLPSWVASGFFAVDGEAVTSQGNWIENSFARIGLRWSLLVFVLEFIKGLAAMSLVYYLKDVPEISVLHVNIPIEVILALVVILGHTFPVYARFSRSMSVGAYFGVFAGLWLIPTLSAVFVFAAIWMLVKKVSINVLIISLSSLVIITFMLFDLKALVMVTILSTTLLLTHLPLNFKEVTV